MRTYLMVPAVIAMIVGLSGCIVPKSEYQRVANDLQQVRSQKEAAKKKLSELKVELAEKNLKFESLREGRESLEKERSVLASQLARLYSRMSELESGGAAGNSGRDPKLGEQVGALHERLNELARMNDALKGRIAQSEQEKASLAARMQAL
jgi:chromosome segregation ATPase